MQVYIVPTYDCNLNCNGCYSKKFLKENEEYLSWEKFIQVFSILKDQSNNFALIGGEPAKWKFINEAILFLKNKKKTITVFTNATIPIHAKPTNMVINGTNLFDVDLKDNIIQQLEIYKSQGIKITLRFNINSDFTEVMLNEAVSISKTMANSVSVSLLFPTEFNQSIGTLIFSLCEQLVSNNVKVRVSRATPLCIFSTEQRVYLKKHCRLSGQCSLPSNSIVINPDGETIQPCVELKLFKKVTDLSECTPKELFRNDIQHIKNKENLICAKCEFFKNKQCCGGCLSYKC